MNDPHAPYRIICLAILALLQTSRCLIRALANKPDGWRSTVIADSLIAAVIILATPSLIP